jgi:hypothetical protein
MGCSNSKAIETNEQKRPIEGVLRTGNKLNSAHSSHSAIPKSVAFEVALEEKPANGSATNPPPEPEKKSLPKRLLERLQEKSGSKETKAEKILEKQRKAEERRLQVLDERQSKARASISNVKAPQERIESRMGDHPVDDDDERHRTPTESPAKK